jgi:hypothetical protein
VFTAGSVFLVDSVLLIVIVFCIVLFAMFDFVLLILTLVLSEIKDDHRHAYN